MTYEKDKLERFAFRLDAETARFLKEDSKALGMSSSAYLRMLVLQRRANLAVTRDVQEKANKQAEAAIAKFAGDALALLRSESDSPADVDKMFRDTFKQFVADKADNPTNENK